MSVTYQSPTQNWSGNEYNVLSYPTKTANETKHNLKPTQDFINAISNKQNQQTTQKQDEKIDPLHSHDLHKLLDSAKILLIDVRSSDHYSKDHIKSAIHISIPSILLKRKSYTLDKVTESLHDQHSIQAFKQWHTTTHIIFYDHASNHSSITCTLLAEKFKPIYDGSITYLKGGFEEFKSLYPQRCYQKNELTSTPETSSFFFNNIRQNLELSHGPLKERFAIRMPHGKCPQINGTIQVSPTPTHPPRFGFGGSSIDSKGDFILPIWLKQMISEPSGPKKLAENYEYLERMEQERLSFVMKFHSSHKSTDFPLSIASSMEKGTLNRYNNIWPYEYSRVKLSDKKDNYINASYLQYAVIKNDAVLSPTSPLSNMEQDMIKLGLVSHESLETMRHPTQLKKDRKYIATQGPLPATFNDFWKMVWDENSNVIVMLTNEEEIEKVKCHRYWPSSSEVTQNYGPVTVSLTSKQIYPVMNVNDKRSRKECIIIRKFNLKHRSSFFQDRDVTHFQYTGWSDFGVPDHPIGLLQLVHLANEACQGGPFTVHCSAGCGRTGTFCVIETVIQRLWQERDIYTSSSVDKIIETVSRFREQRMSSVQTHRQYVFCYEVILWWLLGYGHLPALDSDDMVDNSD